MLALGNVMDAIPSVGVIILKDGKALLTKEGEKSFHLTGKYAIPSGVLVEGESEKAFAIRKLKEETGLDARETDLREYPENIYTALIERKGGTSEVFSMRVFICLNFKGELKATEKTSPEWVNFSDLKNKLLLPNVEKIANDAQKYILENLILEKHNENHTDDGDDGRRENREIKRPFSGLDFERR